MIFKKALVYCLLLVSTAAFGQYNNSLRFNLTGAAVQLYGVQYEHKLSSKVGFNNTFFYRPKVDIPFGNTIDNFAKNNGVGVTGIRFDYIFMNEAKVGLKGYSPELRFYFGSPKHPGFIGIFGMTEKFDMEVPASLVVLRNDHVLDVKLPVNFRFSALSGGILIGKQFRWNRVGLDVVVAGPHFGRVNDFYASGENVNIQNLNEVEKEYFKNQVKDRFGLQEKYFKMDINDEKAEISSIRNIPYLGIRGVGLNLSYYF